VICPKCEQAYDIKQIENHVRTCEGKRRDALMLDIQQLKEGGAGRIDRKHRRKKYSRNNPLGVSKNTDVRFRLPLATCSF
jgi:hypothetical protein